MFHSFVSKHPIIGKSKNDANACIFDKLALYCDIQSPMSHLGVEPVVEGAQGRVLEHQLQPPAIILVSLDHRHQQQDVGVGHAAEVVQLPGVGLLLHRHLGQVPQLAHQPGPGPLLLLAGVPHGNHSGVPQRLKIFSYNVFVMIFVGRKNIVPPELDRKAGTCK